MEVTGRVETMASSWFSARSKENPREGSSDGRLVLRVTVTEQAGSALDMSVRDGAAAIGSRGMCWLEPSWQPSPAGRRASWFRCGSAPPRCFCHLRARLVRGAMRLGREELGRPQHAPQRPERGRDKPGEGSGGVRWRQSVTSCGGGHSDKCSGCGGVRRWGRRCPAGSRLSRSEEAAPRSRTLRPRPWRRRLCCRPRLPVSSSFELRPLRRMPSPCLVSLSPVPRMRPATAAGYALPSPRAPVRAQSGGASQRTAGIVGGGGGPTRVRYELEPRGAGLGRASAPLWFDSKALEHDTAAGLQRLRGASWPVHLACVLLVRS